MNKATKILLGIASLLPWIYIVYFIRFALKLLDATSVEESDALFNQMLIPHFSAMVLSLLLLAIFIIHIVKNNRLSETAKLFWGIVIVFGNLVGMPIYWFLHIWRDSQKTQ